MTDKPLSLWQRLKRALTSSNPVADEYDGGNSIKQNQPDAKANVNDASSHQTVSSRTNHQKLPKGNIPSAKLKNLKAQRRSETQSRKTPPIEKQKVQKPRALPAATSDSSDFVIGEITPIIMQFLTERQWQFSHTPPKSQDIMRTHHLSMRMRSETFEWGCLFRIQEETQLVAVYGILPFLIPDSHRNAALLLAAQINYDLIIGNIELDLHDGELRFKNALDAEVTGLDDPVLHNLIQSVIAMTSLCHDLFSDLLQTEHPSDDPDVLIQEMRQKAQARQYFMPTHQRQ